MWLPRLWSRARDKHSDSDDEEELQPTLTTPQPQHVVQVRDRSADPIAMIALERASTDDGEWEPPRVGPQRRPSQSGWREPVLSSAPTAGTPARRSADMFTWIPQWMRSAGRTRSRASSFSSALSPPILPSPPRAQWSDALPPQLARHLRFLACVLVSALIAGYITGGYPFNMMGCVTGCGEHSAYDLGMRSSLAAAVSGGGGASGAAASIHEPLALASQAYAAEYTWTFSMLGSELRRIIGQGQPHAPAPAPASSLSPSSWAQLESLLPSDQLGPGVTPSNDPQGQALWPPDPAPPTAQEKLLKALQALPSAKGGLSAPPALPLPSSMSRSLFIVTSASAHQFDRVRNLIASLHFWTSASRPPMPRATSQETATASRPRPPYQLILYDVGLTHAQRSELHCTRFVRLVRPNYSLSRAVPAPLHLRVHATSSLLPLMFTDTLLTRSEEWGIEVGDAVLHLSAELEWRSSPAEIASRLWEQGVLSTLAPGGAARALRHSGSSIRKPDRERENRRKHGMASRAHARTLHLMGLDAQSMMDKPMCSVDVIGFVKSPASAPTAAAKSTSPLARVLPLVTRCVSALDCVAPTGSSQAQRDPAVVWSLALHAAGIGCGSGSHSDDTSSPASASAVFVLGDGLSANLDHTLPTPMSGVATGGSPFRAFALAYRSDHAVKPYLPHIIVDRAPKTTASGATTAQCMPQPLFGWTAPPLPPAALTAQGALPALTAMSSSLAGSPSTPQWFAPSLPPRPPRGVSYRRSHPSVEEVAVVTAEESLLECLRRVEHTKPAPETKEVGNAQQQKLLDFQRRCAAPFMRFQGAWRDFTAASTKFESPPLSGAAGGGGWDRGMLGAVRDRMRCGAFWLMFLILLALLASSRLRRKLRVPSLTSSPLRLLCVVIMLAVWLFVWIPLYQVSLERWGTFAPWNAIAYTHPYRLPDAKVRAATLDAGRAADIDLGTDSSHTLRPAYAISKEVAKLTYPSSLMSTSNSKEASSPPPSSSMPWTPTAAEVAAGPPPGWRPPHRVVTSFTMMPHHVLQLRDTLDSLLAQTLLPDAIYINLPLGRNKRTNQSYEVAPYLEDMVRKHAPTLQILRCEDKGPLTKLVPTLLAESDPNTFVITVDSDKIYHPHTVATLAWRSWVDPHAAFGLCGWSFYWQPPPMGVVPVYVPWAVRGPLGRSVDVLQACCGNVYRRAFFPDLELLRRPHPKCFTTDDLWIAAYLSTRAHVRRVLISSPDAWSSGWQSLEPATPSWKADDPAQWQLSSHNSKKGVDMACVRGAEEWLGPWRLVRQIENEEGGHN